MSMNQVRKPSAASESFITALAVLFFISLALLFQFLDGNKNDGSTQKIEQKPVRLGTQNLSGNQINPLPPFTQSSSTKEIAENTYTFSSIKKLDKIEVNPSLYPPLPQLDVPKQTITVDAGSGQLFTSSNKSIITIPPYAFLDKDGKIVEGSVEVSYREFYNYLDFFRSGIPMHYDSGDGSQLESAGMFELTASKDNEPVYANPQNRIKVMLASLSNSPDYNMYYFDKQQNKWIYKGQSEATVSENSQSFRQQVMFRDSFERTFTFEPTVYNLQLNGMKEPAGKRKNIFSLKPTVDAFSFHFIAARQSVPGLNKLSSVRWRYTGNDARHQFNKIMISGKHLREGLYYRQSWNNAMIYHEPEDDTYLLTLCNEADTVSLKIIPTLTTERSIKKFKANFSNFITLQDSRLTAEKDRFIKFRQDTANYFATNSRFAKYEMTASTMAMRQFQLDGFGIWNCDRPIQLANATTVNATFVDEDNNPIKPDMVYLADKSVNTLFIYYKNKLDKFKFNPSAQNLVWAVFPGDIVVIIKPKEFMEKYSRSESTCVFKVNMRNNEELTQSKMKSQLAFDM